MKMNERVWLLFNTAATGTVTWVWPDGRFRVSYDSERGYSTGRRSSTKIHGGRYVYRPTQAGAFGHGNPPSS